MRANFAAALDQRENGFLTRASDVSLVPLASVLVLLFAADIAFVKFNGLALTAKRASRLQIAHAFANALCHKPRSLVRQTNHAMKLMGAHALFAGAHEMRRQQPFRHWNVRPLIDRADCRREFLSAVFAVKPTRPHGFSAQRGDPVNHAAVGAIRTSRPADRLEMLPGSFRVREDRVRQIDRSRHIQAPSMA